MGTTYRSYLSHTSMHLWPLIFQLAQCVFQLSQDFQDGITVGARLGGSCNPIMSPSPTAKGQALSSLFLDPEQAELNYAYSLVLENLAYRAKYNWRLNLAVNNCHWCREPLFFNTVMGVVRLKKLLYKRS